MNQQSRIVADRTQEKRAGWPSHPLTCVPRRPARPSWMSGVLRSRLVALYLSHSLPPSPSLARLRRAAKRPWPPLALLSNHSSSQLKPLPCSASILYAIRALTKASLGNNRATAGALWSAAMVGSLLPAVSQARAKCGHGWPWLGWVSLPCYCQLCPR
jgi:hypothetical protein